ncbi:splicing factor, suppressor of white-apricot homolog isoform X1 [Lytechinus pictus]|uniref:splicing factor, suppressor of white-apricot homolog isoform X1 n=1 Tax=Lytechinus pictus TaxID=7653 RepID=UPI0030BA23E4
MALHTDLLEEQNRHEEELKRLNEAITSDQGYNAMAFGYGNEDYDPMQPTEDEREAREKKLVAYGFDPPTYKEEDSSATAAAELEEPFIAPPQLKLPPGMEQPMTSKIHVIIEKTAMFVLNHGPQMEIIVKTKQANNPQFDFLQFDHFLNPYYKHVMAAIKSKMYIPTMLQAPESDKKKQGEIISRRSSNSNSLQSDDEDDDLEGSGYLHPSLFAPPKPKPSISAVQVRKVIAPPKPKPSISAVQHPPVSAPPPDNIPAAQLGIHHREPFPLMEPHQQPHQLMAYYEGEPVTTSAPFALPPMLAPPPPPMDHSNAGGPVQMSHPMGQLAPPGFLPGEPPLPGPVMPHHHPALSSHDIPHPHPPTAMLGPPLISQELAIPHASEESAMEPQPLPIVPPPPDIQPVIDKLAKYVAKNGDEFEASVRAKCDPRFEFLVPWHSYNAYYLAKKKMFIQEFNQGAESSSGDQKSAADKSKKVPVRFPIKPKKAEERTLGRKSALPVESSSDSDDQEDSNQSTSASNPQVRKLPTQDVQYRDMMGHDESEQRYGGMQYDHPGGVQGTGEGDALYPYQEYEQEEMDDRGMVEYGREHQRTGGNHQRLEDRLAMAARKKLASASQERSVQVERRKKLALFLSQVKDRPQAAAAASQESGMSDAERDYREDSDRSHLASRQRSPPVRPSRRDRTASPPYTESRSSRKAPSMPKSYQTAVNREQLERERRRKRHSRSRSPSPRKMKRKSPPPFSAGTSSAIGRSSSTSSPSYESFQEREASPGSDSTSKTISQLNTQQASGSETKTDAKGGASDLRAKIRAMLAATMSMSKEDIG